MKLKSVLAAGIVTALALTPVYFAAPQKAAAAPAQPAARPIVGHPQEIHLRNIRQLT